MPCNNKYHEYLLVFRMSTRTIQDRTFTGRRPVMEQQIDSLQIPTILRAQWWDGHSPMSTIITKLDEGSRKVEEMFGTWNKELSVPVKR